MNTAILVSLRIPSKAGNLLHSCLPISFSKKKKNAFALFSCCSKNDHHPGQRYVEHVANSDNKFSRTVTV
jgi:hypothetical protein